MKIRQRKGFTLSASAEPIDLNSDVVLVDGENEADRVNQSEPTVVGVSESGSLEDHWSERGRVHEPKVDPLGDIQRANDPVGSRCASGFGENDGKSRIESVVDGFEPKMEAESTVNEVQAGIGPLDEGMVAEGVGYGDSLRGGGMEIDAERIRGDISVSDEREVEGRQVNERSCGEVEEGYCNMDPCPIVVVLNQDVTVTMGVENACDSDSLHNHEAVEVKEADKNHSLHCTSHTGSVDLAVEAVSGEMDNRDMEVDAKAENKENEINSINVPAAAISHNTGALTASNSKYGVFDLVWGKVRSHPWWPGQIFDPSASSDKAKKYFRKDGYLIGYFGDQTFAWNDALWIRPFRSHFSRMEKQSNKEDFHYAVHCALDEVARRVEFGLACSCIPKDVYSKIKTEIIVNAGIQEESSRIEGGDNFSGVASFDSTKLVDHVKGLAENPFEGVDRLEFVTARAQLSAFYRWKGYPQLPELQVLGGLLESDAKVPLAGEVRHCSELNENVLSDARDNEQVLSVKGTPKAQDDTSCKRKHKHIDGDTVHPRKKEKSLSELMAESRLSVLKGKSGSASHKLSSSLSSGKKRKALDIISNESAEKHENGSSTKAANKSSQAKPPSFSVGNSILRVASQLSWLSPIFKSCNETSQMDFVDKKGEERSLSKKSRSKSFIITEDSSPVDLLSQLCLVAKDPMKGYSFLISVVSFFSEFRKSVSLDVLSSPENEWSLELTSDCESHKSSRKSENARTSDLEHMKGSYWSDRIIECLREEQSSIDYKNAARDFLPETPVQKDILKDIPSVEQESSVQLSPDLDSEGQVPDVALGLVPPKPIRNSEESCQEDISPTALILNFTDLNSVPSETNLNEIFSRFGPLNELDTEVLKKSSRAKVVFKRRADAETAFSSAGKYSIFGPSLVSYRLRYISSTPRKGSPNATKESQKVIKPMSGNGA